MHRLQGTYLADVNISKFEEKFMTIAGKWKKEWEAKKKYFEKESGKKKPSEKYFGFFSKGSGLTKAFEKMDAEYNKLSKMDLRLATRSAFDEFDKAIKTAERAGDSYTAVLKKAIAKESSKKELLPLLQILIDDIDMCITSAEAELAAAWEEAHKGSDDRKAEIAKRKPLKARVLSAVKEGAMWIAIQQRKPDATEFKKGINTVAGNVAKYLKELSDCYEPGYDTKIKGPLEMLTAWAKIRMPATIGDEELVDELGELKKVLASVVRVVKNLQ